MSDSAQLSAERSHTLIELVNELGGIAHQDMATEELDAIVDNMLSKGIPNVPSPELLRWIHKHRGKPGMKIAQILGAHVNKASSIIPECFARFYDPTAVECKACLDRTMCSVKSRSASAPDKSEAALYQISNAQTILNILQGKSGQIAKSLSHGSRVVLEVHAGKFKLSAVTDPNESGQALKENDNMATKKGAPQTSKKAAEPVEEEEVDLSLTEGADEDEGTEEVEEAIEETEGAEEEAEEEVAAPAPKVKKAPKPKPVLNKAQQEFQDHLNGLDSEGKRKYSAQIAKKLGIKVAEKGDDRIDHMLRCMEIKKHLGGASKPAPAAAPAKKAVAKK